MAIRIQRNEQGNCINFHGATNPTYWNACLSAQVDSTDVNTVNVINDIITAQTGTTQYEFFRIPYTEFTDADGNGFSTPQDAADYITEKANVVGLGGGGTELTGETVCFKLDETSTSIMLDNGHSYGVNTIKALNTGDGLITINSMLGDITHFTKLDHANVCDGDGVAISGGLNDVINYLNELFTVGAFEQVVISDPYSTMVADVSGVDAGYTLEGADAVDPIGDDIFTYDGAGYANYAGLKSTATIDQAGEYYTFDIRGEGTIGFGLVHTQESFDGGLFSGNSSYADPSSFAAVNSAHYGFQFSHWFHPTPNGSWTNYGANTGYSMRSGWSNFNGTDEQADWLAGNPIKVRCGIDDNGYISISTLRDGSTWEVHARSSYPVIQGSSYHLGIKSQSASARVYTAPKVHLLEPEAPTMYFRYIESPDGVFNYPLFNTAAEAEYYDEIVNGLTVGTGSSHTHTYADDATGTTWYMPEASHDASTYVHSSAPSGSETFNGNAVTYTEITSLTNADLTPTQFSSTDYTYQEGTVVNLQVTPQGASWSTSVSITPSGSGLVYDGYSLIQGTLSDVSTDTIYTVSVTRANSYGSSIGTFEIQVTDVAPVQTNDTPWTKALDFSGSNEHLKQVSNSSLTNPIAMGFTGTTVPAHNSFPNKTSNNTYSRPFATVVVFKADGNNSNQHIWNYGEGASSGDDNIYLKLDAQNQLQFNWGRVNAGSLNQMRVASGIQTNTWYGVYIAHKGARYSSSNATSSNLADAFDVRLMSSGDSFTALGNNLSTSSNWTSTGGRMDRAFGGHLTIGGRGSNRNFHGKVASMIVTTLLTDTNMPTDAEIKTMITDPVKWLNDYKIGVSYRSPNLQYAQYVFTANGNNEGRATQVWLMGDGTSDSYANGMRNYVYPADQNYTKMQLNSMVSNDIETVNINGLT
jgi:hypothetical protein